MPYEPREVDEERLKKMKTNRDNEVKMFAIFKEIAAYTIYIIIVCTLSYDNRDPLACQSKEELYNIFVKNSFAEVCICPASDNVTRLAARFKTQTVELVTPKNDRVPYASFW